MDGAFYLYASAHTIGAFGGALSSCVPMIARAPLLALMAAT